MKTKNAEKRKISKPGSVFLGSIVLISFCFFSASYFFNKSSELYFIPIPYLVASLVFWITQPIATWKKPFVVIATTLIGSVFGFLLILSAMVLPGSRQHQYVMYEICAPALEKYYRQRGQAGLADIKNNSKEGPSRWFVQHEECERNVWAGKGPVFSENPPDFAPADQTANWKTYKNTNYGFSFKYPQEWHYTELSENLASNLLFDISFNKLTLPAHVKSYNMRVTLYSNNIDFQKRFLNYSDAETKTESKIKYDYLNGKEIIKAEVVTFYYDMDQNKYLETEKNYVVLIPIGNNTFEFISKLDQKETIDKIVTTFIFIE